MQKLQYPLLTENELDTSLCGKFCPLQDGAKEFLQKRQYPILNCIRISRLVSEGTISITWSVATAQSPVIQ